MVQKNHHSFANPAQNNRARHLTKAPTACLIAPLFGQIAQSVEQRTENPRVGGSIPPLANLQVTMSPYRATKH